MSEFFHPSIFFVVCAAAVWLLPGRLGRWLPPVAAALAIASVLAMQPGAYTRFSYLGLTLGLGRVDSLSMVFAHVFAIPGPDRVHLRPARGGPLAARSGLNVHRRRLRLHLRRRLCHALHLLGIDERRFYLPGVAAAYAGFHACGRTTAILKDFKELQIFGPGNPYTKNLFSQDKGQKEMVRAFIDAIRKGSAAPIPFEEIHAATLATFKVMESLRTGQAVNLPFDKILINRICTLHS